MYNPTALDLKSNTWVNDTPCLVVLVVSQLILDEFMIEFSGVFLYFLWCLFGISEI